VSRKKKLLAKEHEERTYQSKNVRPTGENGSGRHPPPSRESSSFVRKK
jgi:hypothetical protein